MTQRCEFSIESNPNLYEEIRQLLAYVSEIITYESEVIKLKEHPIKDWYEYFYSNIYFDLINEAHLMMSHKEVIELYEDFKNSKNSNLKKLVFNAKNLSIKLTETYVDSEFKKSYLKAHTCSSKNIDREEMKSIRFMKDF
jgi:hypothetical protein